MEHLEIYLSSFGAIIGLLITSLTFLVKLIKNSKIKKRIETILKVTTSLLPFIEEAESFVNYTGNEKKAYVMTRVKELLINNHIKLDEEEVNQKIEQLIFLTKQVNSKKTKKLDKLSQEGE